jgi:hypothetical protein
MEVDYELHGTAALLREKEPQVKAEQETIWAPEPVSNWASAGNENPVVHPLAVTFTELSNLPKQDILISDHTDITTATILG